MVLDGASTTTYVENLLISPSMQNLSKFTIKIYFVDNTWTKILRVYVWTI